MKKLFVLAVILVLMGTAASAQRAGDHIRRERIENGVRSGQLTRPERLKLRHDELRYRGERRRAHRDGVVTPRERARLHHMRKHERREIFRMKHNGRRRLI